MTVYVFSVGFCQFFGYSREAASLARSAWARQLADGYGQPEALSPIWRAELADLAPDARPVSI